MIIDVHPIKVETDGEDMKKLEIPLIMSVQETNGDDVLATKEEVIEPMLTGELASNANHENLVKCEDDDFRERLRRNRHILETTKTERRKYECFSCHKQFRRPVSLRSHLYSSGICSKDGSRQERLQCPHCPSTCLGERSLQRHIDRIHAKYPVLECDYCHKVYKNRYQIIRHFHDCHNPNRKEKTREACPICGRLYDRSYLKRHISWIHKKTEVEGAETLGTISKNSLCPHCGMSFHTLGQLQAHIRSRHTDIRPFECHLCERKFAQLGMLKTHLTTHSDARPYKCKLCDKWFKTKGSVKGHMNSMHSNVKRHICKICGHAFHLSG